MVSPEIYGFEGKTMETYGKLQYITIYLSIPNLQNIWKVTWIFCCQIRLKEGSLLISSIGMVGTGAGDHQSWTCQACCGNCTVCSSDAEIESRHLGFGQSWIPLKRTGEKPTKMKDSSFITRNSQAPKTLLGWTGHCGRSS